MGKNYQNVKVRCELARLRLKLEHPEQTVVSSTGDETLVFVPGDTFQMDIVGDGDLSTHRNTVTPCELNLVAVY